MSLTTSLSSERGVLALQASFGRAGGEASQQAVDGGLAGDEVLHAARRDEEGKEIQDEQEGQGEQSVADERGP